MHAGTVTLVCGTLVLLAASLGSAGALATTDHPRDPIPSAPGPDPTVDGDRSGALSPETAHRAGTDGETDPADPCPDGPTDPPPADPGDDPRIVSIHPNPTTEGNVGEFFVLEVPPGAEAGNLTVTDGHTTAVVPEPPAGRVAVSTDPEETRRLTDHRVVELEGHLRLAADGDDLELRTDGRVVDGVAYDRASTAETWHRSDDGDGVWWPAGATCLPTTTTDADEATAFVLPDSPDVPLETLADAEERILLAGYTFTSEAVADELRAAHDRGVEVAVLLEGGPVGGTPERTREVLDELEAAGVDVRVLGGEGARYSYHHPKYAVVDDTAIVLTENWKPAGTGGAASRGWGVIVDEPVVTSTLADVFRADFEGRDATPWGDHRETATFVEDEPGGGGFEERVAPETVAVDEVELLLAPDNAEERTRGLLADAEESIRIKQVRIGDPEFSLLEESLEAARRGVEVRILLDATWYVEDENRELADALERTAREEGLPLEVRLVEPDGRFEKLHAKGVVIDGETAIVGSPNWNENAFRNNREVALVLHGEEVGAFYADVFDDDWEGQSWPLPVGLGGAVAVGVVAVSLLGRRYLAFEPSKRERDDEPNRRLP